jgi:hypothetical protein
LSLALSFKRNNSIVEVRWLAVAGWLVGCHFR